MDCGDGWQASACLVRRMSEKTPMPDLLTPGARGLTDQVRDALAIYQYGDLTAKPSHFGKLVDTAKVEGPVPDAG